jgi:hypothetical protein
MTTLLSRRLFLRKAASTLPAVVVTAVPTVTAIAAERSRNRNRVSEAARQLTNPQPRKPTVRSDPRPTATAALVP